MDPYPDLMQQVMDMTRDPWLQIGTVVAVWFLVGGFIWTQVKRRFARSAVRTCEGCRGAGSVKRIVDDENEGLPHSVKCPICKGAGTVSA